MSMTMTSAQPWTAASIDTALVHINTALSRTRRHPGSTVDDRVIEEASLLKLHLEQNPRDCTPEGRSLCEQLLEACMA